MYQKIYNELEILTLYTKGYRKQYYLREISKLTKLPLRTVQNTISFLEKKRILKARKSGRNLYFSLNLDNIQTKFHLIQAEIYKTIYFLEKYPLAKVFLKGVKENNVLIVFGSFARLEADEDSDFDLLVIADEKENLPYHLMHYKVHEIRLPEKLFSKSLENQETLIKEIEENHVIINNHSYYVNKLWKFYGKQKA